LLLLNHATAIRNDSLEVNFIRNTKHVTGFMLLSFRVEIITDFCLGNVKEKYHLEDLVLDGKIMLECILNKLYEKLWTALFWLMMGTNGDIL
jgi:hypothetical protein